MADTLLLGGLIFLFGLALGYEIRAHKSRRRRRRAREKAEQIERQQSAFDAAVQRHNQMADQLHGSAASKLASFDQGYYSPQLSSYIGANCSVGAHPGRAGSNAGDQAFASC